MQLDHALADAPSLQSVLEDPYPLLAQYRERGEILFSPVEKGWIVTSHAAVIEVLRATSDFSNHSNGIERILQGADGEKHLIARRAVNAGFAPSILERLEPVLRETARASIEEAIALGSVESVSMLAQPMPTKVFSQIAGAPSQDGARLIRWGSSISSHARLIAPSERSSVNARRMLMRAARKVSDPSYREFLEARDVIASLLRGQRSELGTTPMIHALRELVAAGSAEWDDVIGVGLEFVFASTETTMGLIAFIMKRLAADRDLLCHLRDHGNHRESFVEEVLRFDSPVMKLNRRVKRATEFRGLTLSAGDRVFAVIAAANRDPAVFERPDVFDFTRAPNRHLAFGMGPHSCPGARLARLEARIFLDEFLDRVADVRIDPLRPLITYRGLGVTRGIAEMHLVIS